MKLVLGRGGRVTSARHVLDDRLRVLWPSPDDTAITRRPSWRARPHELLVLPTLRTATWLVPADDPRTHTAIRRTDQGQGAHRRWSLLAGLHARGALRLLPIARVHARMADSPALCTLRDLVPDAATFSIRIGRARHGRTTVVHVLDSDGRALGLGKIGYGPGIAGLRNERDQLLRVGSRGIAGLRTPAPMAYVETKDHAVLVMTALQTREQADDTPPVAEMRRVADIDGPEVPVETHPATDRLSRKIYALAGSPDQGWLLRGLTGLLRDYGDLALPVAAAHGDWAPWNTARDDRQVAVWDWEGYAEDLVPGLDHLHYLAQRRRTVDGTGGAQERRWLAEARSALTLDWGLRAEQAEAIIRVYLLDVNATYAAAQHADPRGSRRRDGWARSLVERLSAGPSAPAGSLRVLHVTEQTATGVLALMRTYVAALADRGHEQHVLSAPEAPVLPGSRRYERRLVRRNPLSWLGYAAALRSLVRQVRPNLVHLHSFPSGLVGRLPGVMPGGRDQPAVVYQPHAWSDEFGGRRALGVVVRVIERLAARRTDLVVVNTDEERSHGVAIGVRAPSQVLGFGVDLEHFRPPSEDERRAARLGLGLGDRWCAVLVGRWGYQKGQDLLLSAWSAAAPDGVDLVFVGPGEPPPETLAGSPASVQWRGGTDDVRSWFWAADTLVVAARYDSPGLVAAEAIACGLPVLSTAVHGAHALLVDPPHDPAGAVVAVGDAEALMRELTARVGDDDRRRREAAAARLRAERLLAEQPVVDRLVAAYYTTEVGR